jgi:hypothetical protein
MLQEASCQPGAVTASTFYRPEPSATSSFGGEAQQLSITGAIRIDDNGPDGGAIGGDRRSSVRAPVRIDAHIRPTALGEADAGKADESQTRAFRSSRKPATC